MRKLPPRTPSFVNTSRPTHSPPTSTADVSPLETMPSPPRTTSSTVAPGVYVVPLSACQHAARTLPQQSAKIPLGDNVYLPSPFCPLVPADQRLLMWTTPHSNSAQASLDSLLPIENQTAVLLRFLDSLSLSTRQSYGAGLLRFTQFCDRLHISETLHMPASDALLSAFVADAAGSYSGNTVHNWLHGLRAWHVLNRAEWHGRDPLPYRLLRLLAGPSRIIRPPPEGVAGPSHLGRSPPSTYLRVPSTAAALGSAEPVTLEGLAHRVEALSGPRMTLEDLARRVDALELQRDTQAQDLRALFENQRTFQRGLDQCQQWGEEFADGYEQLARLWLTENGHRSVEEWKAAV
ncbi:hypothetical protein D9615_008190 [Tricholomella constricta]|uniref:Uncharacterized protein n=1 Tax=Tricholomella constricta TaxID=117010 RepID=A0A8H5H3E5_9AGAR|nr:hypothetical protein D9615_008190 [Tricholomella constricta]